MIALVVLAVFIAFPSVPIEWTGCTGKESVGGIIRGCDFYRLPTRGGKVGTR